MDCSTAEAHRGTWRASARCCSAARTPEPLPDAATGAGGRRELSTALPAGPPPCQAGSA